MNCPHLVHLGSHICQPPNHVLEIEDCIQCFHLLDHKKPIGPELEICTACLLVFCPKHAYTHYNKAFHQFSISIREAFELNTGHDLTEYDDDRSELQTSGLEHNGSDKDPNEPDPVLQCALRCWQCGTEGIGQAVPLSDDVQALDLVNSIMDYVMISLATDIEIAGAPESRRIVPPFLVALLSTKPFVNRYRPSSHLHNVLCSTSDPRSCFDCQIHKVSQGIEQITQGESYTEHRLDLRGVIRTFDRTSMIGKGSDSLGSAFQKLLAGAIRASSTGETLLPLDKRNSCDPYTYTKALVEVRMQCLGCGGLRYSTETCRVVDLERQAVNPVQWLTKEEVSLPCTKCTEQFCYRSRGFQRFPRLLVVAVPEGSPYPLQLDSNRLLDIDAYHAHGLQEGEVLLPEPRALTPPNRTRTDLTRLSPTKLRTPKKDVFPRSRLSPSPLKRNQDAYDRLRNTTPSPTKRSHTLETTLPSPMKKAQELAKEEMENIEALETDIGAICALGFDRELVIDALEETDGSVKQAIRLLLTWESDEQHTALDEEYESEENAADFEDYDTNFLLDSAAHNELFPPRINENDNDTDNFMTEKGPPPSGRYMLKAVVVEDTVKGDAEGKCYIWTEHWIWQSSAGVLQLHPEKDARHEDLLLGGARLEFWERF